MSDEDSDEHQHSCTSETIDESPNGNHVTDNENNNCQSRSEENPSDSVRTDAQDTVTDGNIGNKKPNDEWIQSLNAYSGNTSTFTVSHDTQRTTESDSSRGNLSSPLSTSNTVSSSASSVPSTSPQLPNNTPNITPNPIEDDIDSLFPDEAIDERNVLEEIATFVSHEPRTVLEVHEEISVEHDLSRDQVEYRLNKLTENNIIQSKKGPGKTSPQIFWTDI